MNNEIVKGMTINYLKNGNEYIAEISPTQEGWYWEVYDGHSGISLGHGRTRTDLDAMNDAGMFVNELKDE